MILTWNWSTLRAQVGRVCGAMRHIAIANAALSTFVWLACTNEPSQKPSQAPPPPPPKAAVTTVFQMAAGDVRSTHLFCMRPDSLRLTAGVIQFGEVASDATTGDVAGLVFRLSIADSGLTGEVLEAAGEFGPKEPLADLRLDLRGETIHFAYGEGENRSQFTGRISCDSMWGRWELEPKQVLEGKAFQRMK